VTGPSARLEIAEVSTEDLDLALLAGGGIDRPRAGERSDAWALDLRGWAVGRAEPAVEVELAHDGEPLARVPLDVERPQAAAPHPEASGRTTVGFHAAVGALPLALDFELEVRAVLAGGRRARVGVVRGRRTRLTTGFEPSLEPLLVTTLGRTGSMVLMRMLEAHPELLVYRPFRYEQQVAGYWLSVLLSLSEPGSYLRQVAPAGNLEDPLWWLGGGPGPRELRDAPLQSWLGSEGVESLAHVCQERVAAVYGQIASRAGKPEAAFFAEKYSLRTAQIARELYPGARELFLVRDFRDMVASILAFNRRRGVQGFGRAAAGSDLEWVEGLAGWSGSLVRAWRARSGGSGGSHLVRYEDLMLRPERVLAGVLSYTGVDPAPARVEEMLAAASPAMPELAEHRTAESAPGSIGRWRTDLEPDLAAACERSFGEALREFGYEAG
jgi:hypothetical protein